MEKETESKPNNKTDKKTQQDHLTIILLSDIHMARTMLDLLKIWFLSKKIQNIDYVLCQGDFHNLEEVDQQNPTTLDGAEKDIGSVLSFLEFFHAPILYIPGNHDSIRMFKSDAPVLTEKSFNVHGKRIEIVPGLQVVGFGGSIPAFDSKTKEKEWQGYPFKSDDEYKKEFVPVVERYCSPSVQTILMTHVGPMCSSTSHSYSGKIPGVPVLSGSEAHLAALLKEEMNILLQLHGHSHDGLGRGNCAGIPIINPGALIAGDMGVITLMRKEGEGKWHYQSIEMINLNAWKAHASPDK